MDRTERAARIDELLAKYPEPWVIEKEPHDYNDGTTHFTHVRYRTERHGGITVSIGEHVTPDLAELLVLLKEAASDQKRTCATCHAALADGPQPAATHDAN